MKINANINVFQISLIQVFDIIFISVYFVSFGLTIDFYYNNIGVVFNISRVDDPSAAI